MQDESTSLAALFHDLVRTETRHYNALNERLRLRHGLYASQFEFLRYLRDHPRSRVADVARCFAVAIGGTSKGVDRLVAQGLLRRLPNPADRRSSLLELTEAGAEAAAAAEETFEDMLDELVAPLLEPRERERVAAALLAIRSALEEGDVGTPTG